MFAFCHLLSSKLSNCIKIRGTGWPLKYNTTYELCDRMHYHVGNSHIRNAKCMKESTWSSARYIQMPIHRYHEEVIRIFREWSRFRSQNSETLLQKSSMVKIVEHNWWNEAAQINMFTYYAMEYLNSVKPLDVLSIFAISERRKSRSSNSDIDFELTNTPSIKNPCPTITLPL